MAFSCRVENARPPALGDEISRAVDVALGPSFRGTCVRACSSGVDMLFERLIGETEKIYGGEQDKQGGGCAVM